MKTHSTKALWLSVGVALGLHALLFVVMWNDENKTIHTESDTHTIEVKLLAKAQPQRTSTDSNPQPHATTQQTKPLTNQNTPPAQTRPEKTTISTDSKTTPQKSQLASSSLNNSNALYKLLYHAINQQKHYPLAALRMHQQGTVRVTFKLFHNGNVDELAILQSSGYHSLDNAALRAIKRIQPFYPAAEHIASVKGFQLDIIFQL